MPRRSLQDWIVDEDRYARLRHDHFRRAAEFVSVELAAAPEVEAVWLFGSVARPLQTRITRRGWEMLHHCKDVDLAVWVDSLDRLKALNRARSKGVSRLLSEAGIGVAHHQVDIFLFAPGSNQYLGRLCSYGSCPKGKPSCTVPGCGREPLLQQHEGFVLDPAALAEDRVVRLFDRADVGAKTS